MFILLVIILSFISIALKISASGLELAYKISKRSKKKRIPGVIRLGVITSVKIIRILAFIVSKIRDFIGFLGSFIVIIDVIVLIVVLVSSTSFLVLFNDSDVNGKLIANNASQQMSNSSSGKSNISNIGGKPAGLSSESWNKADDVGKKIISFACNSIINPPNSTPLIYQQGDTPVGYADCSVFVCAVFEGALNKTFGGLDAPNGYDFSKNRKSDLQGYLTTYGMEGVLQSKPQSRIGSTGTSLESAQPGDVLLTDGHVGLYVGKNENGEHVMVHASSHSNPHCNGDINLSDGQKLDVGFSRIGRSYIIIRPSKLLGK